MNDETTIAVTNLVMLICIGIGLVALLVIPGWVTFAIAAAIDIGAIYVIKPAAEAQETE